MSSSEHSSDIENLNPLVKRGHRIAVFTGTLFINDYEEGWIQFVNNNLRTKASIVFEPRYPPHPQLKFEPEGDHFKLLFMGWNAPTAFSVIQPTIIGSYENKQLSVAFCVSRLGETNKLEIQFYEEEI